MTTTLLFLLVCGLAVFMFRMNVRLERESRRNRILQAFTAGIIRAVTDYESKTDALHKAEVPGRPTGFPIHYGQMLENIDWELSKDQLRANYEKWLRENRRLFFDDKHYGDDGFNFMYLDLFDMKVQRWQGNEPQKPEDG